MKIEEVETMAESWLQKLGESGNSKNTVKVYRNGIKRFLEFAKQKEIENLNDESLNIYHGHLIDLLENGQIQKSTFNSRIVSLRKFLKDSGLANPALKTKAIRTVKDKEDFLTLEEYKKLIKCSGELGMVREMLIMKTLAETGVKVGELEIFTVESLKGLNENVELKGKDGRKICPPKELVKELIDYAEQNNIKSGVIFHGRAKDKMLSTVTIWSNLQRIAEKAGISKKKAHSQNFRRLFAREYLSKPGTDIIELSNILGHSHLDTTKSYLP